ncbi:unnamed protein product [Citrullus colocynthis]|uniref:GATA transcription factor n=1 Tax=Citrullus colocynthis TaxID=252529 RepID=A0ABP0XXS3_9ROSI
MEAPEYFQINGYCSQFATHSSSDNDSATATATAAGPEHFIVEELLDFSNDDDAVIGDGGGLSYNNNNNGNNNSTECSTVTVIESCNSSSFLEDISGSNLTDAHFSSELCVPYDDLAELEWLSHFVEESFSSEDMQKLELISGVKVKEPAQSPQPTVSHGRKARSKRSRAVPSNWNKSRLLPLSPTTEPEITTTAGPPHPIKKPPPKAATAKKKDSPEVGVSSGEGRKCMHCATDKTPQWRTGPMGPKTLCNACGVRYKSGRLVPEYRPAASPTFVLTKHSNSHRKVLELRRQKELLKAQQQQQQHLLLDHHQDMIFDPSNGDGYLIHQHVGTDFRQLI